MKCEECGINEANMHFTTIINGKLKERHICNECASKNENIDITDPFSMHKLFTSLIDSLQGDKTKGENLKCDNCNLSYEEFKQSGKFGCTHCYENFSSKLDPLFKGIQGDNLHKGKIPCKKIKEVSKEREIQELEEELKLAVELEEYEKAAVIRDKIKNINLSLSNNKGEANE